MATIKDNILYGIKHEFEPYKKGLGEYFFDLVEKYTENIFQIDPETNEVDTYEDIKRRSTRLALHLKQLGVTKDSIVLTICSVKNDVVPFLSVLFLGATYSYLPISCKSHWKYCINNLEPTHVFVEETLVNELEICLEQATFKPTIILIGESDKYYKFADLLKEHEDENSFRPTEVKNIDDVSVILYSSGTTGVPKGICYSHDCFSNGIINFLGHDGSKFKETWLTFSDTALISGLSQLVMQFHTGSHRIIPPIFDAEKVLQLVDKYKVTFMNIFTCHGEEFLELKNIEHYDLSSLKIVSSGGEYLSPSTLRDLRKFFKNSYVHRQYGLSETVSNGCNFDIGDPLLRKLDSVGYPMRNVELKILDRQSGEILGPYHIGEILIKSKIRMKCYFKRPDLSSIDKQGFFRTGDIGYYDQDACVYLLSRASEVIRYKGFEIYQAHLHNMLKELPHIKEAAIVGIPHETDGHRVAACVVLKENQHITAEEIHNYIAERVEDWQVLRGGIIFLKKLPRSAHALKVDVNDIKKLLLKQNLLR